MLLLAALKRSDRSLLPDWWVVSSHGRTLAMADYPAPETFQSVNKPSASVVDAGSLERALHIVRLLATFGGRGAGLTDLARKSELPHPTVQRLMAQKLVRQLPANRRYALGPLAFELGLAAAQQFDVREACRPSLMRVAQGVGDTAYLVVRSGFEAVCIDRQEGPSPVRVFTL